MRFSHNRVPFRYRLLLGFSIPLIIWLIVSGVNVVSLNESVKRSERLITSQRTILLANEYLNAALGALAAKRGFIITSDPGFLTPYRRAAERVNRVHANIAALMSDSPEQRERLDAAGNLLQQWLYDVARPRIEARRQLPAGILYDAHRLEENLLSLQDMHQDASVDGGDRRASLDAISERVHSILQSSESSPRFRQAMERALAQLVRYERAMQSGDRDEMDDALIAMNRRLTQTIQEIIETDNAIRAVVSSDEGDVLLREFQQIMNQFIQVEEETLEQNRGKMIDATERARLLIHLGPAAGLIVMILVTSWMAQRIGRSLDSVSEAAGELARGNLNARAEVRGGDEFALLAERFNVMAELVGNRSRESAALAELGELLQSCSGMDEATRIFARLANKILPDHPGALYLISPSRDEAAAVVCWGGGEAFSEPEFAPDDCWALRLGRTHHSDEGNTLHCEHMRSFENETVCLPLHAFGDTIGMLLIVEPSGKNAHRRLEWRHNDFLDAVAEQLALALANLRMRETLRNQSIRDPLTGLYNRRYLDESFRRELHRASRHGTPLSVLAFDIDHFKRYNDMHGHDGGDAVLRVVGHCLQEFFRTEDGAFRAGGEEFVAILAETTLKDALTRAEALRKEISRLEIRHENAILPPVTISIGVASYPEHGRVTEQLLKAADRALYHAKKNGRNQVVAAGPR